MNKAVILVATVAAASLGVRPAHATQCSRWTSPLAKCDVVNQTDCDEPEETWSWGVLHNWYNWHYSTTPQKACKKLIMKWHPGEEDLALAVEVYPDYYLCYWDWDGDNIVATTSVTEDPDGDGADDDDYNGVTAVTLKTDIEREPECDLVPQGPYAANSRMYPQPAARVGSGGSFSMDQRNWIRDANVRRHGEARSDAHPLATPQTNINDGVTTWVTRTTFPPYEDDPDENTSMLAPSNDSSMQVDHIIPRIDIHGCRCGSNSYGNAAMISGTLNRKMSNNMRDPDRIKMLQTFVPGYVPPAP